MTKRPTSASPASSRARGRSSTATKASTRSVGSRCSRRIARCVRRSRRESRWDGAGRRGRARGCTPRGAGPWWRARGDGSARAGAHASRSGIRRAPVRSTMERRLSRSSGSNARGLGGRGKVSRPSSRREEPTARRCTQDPEWRDVPSGHNTPSTSRKSTFIASRNRARRCRARTIRSGTWRRGRDLRGERAASPASGARSCVFAMKKCTRCTFSTSAVTSPQPRAEPRGGRARRSNEPSRTPSGRAVGRARRAREGVSQARPRYSLSGRARRPGEKFRHGAMDRTARAGDRMPEIGLSVFRAAGCWRASPEMGLTAFSGRCLFAVLFLASAVNKFNSLAEGDAELWTWYRLACASPRLRSRPRRGWTPSCSSATAARRAGHRHRVHGRGVVRRGLRPRREDADALHPRGHPGHAPLLVHRRAPRRRAST